MPVFHNPIPETTPDVAFMDSLCDGLWLALWWRPVHFSACRLSALLSPLCSIDLFVRSCARPTSAPRKPSITESNTVQIAHFCPSSSFLLTRTWDRVVPSMAHPEQLGTASRSCRGEDKSCYNGCGQRQWTHFLFLSQRRKNE